jgi:hypothetical protein
MDQDLSSRGTLTFVARFFPAMDDTHQMWGLAFVRKGTVRAGEASKALGGFSWTTFGDNHKLQRDTQSPPHTRRTTRGHARHDP